MDSCFYCLLYPHCDTHKTHGMLIGALCFVPVPSLYVYTTNAGEAK